MMACGVTCPILWLTGISCAGCGMTRAWLNVLRLDFAAAFSCHPLWPLVPAAMALILLRHRLPRRLYRCAAALLLAAFLIVYAARMLDPADQIVVFRPAEGVAGKVWTFICEGEWFV